MIRHLPEKMTPALGVQFRDLTNPGANAPTKEQP